MQKMSFEALIERTGRGGAMVRLPPDAAGVFGTRNRFPVHAQFNGVAYRGSTMPLGDGTFCLGVSKAVQREAGVKPGHTVSVVLTRDDVERTVDVPPELVEALARHPGATERFEHLGHTHKKEYAQWVAEAKRPETRMRRVDKAIAMITGNQRHS